MSSGSVGGPFNPTSAEYTLTNAGGSPLDWTVSKAQAWIVLSNSTGTLAGGASTSVTVSIAPEAAGLAAGTYSDTIVFANATNHDGDQNRSLILSVAAPPNQPPTVTVTTAPSFVYEDEPVRIGCTIYDPDGDAVTVRWNQVSGRSVVLSGMSTATISFTVPTTLLQSDQPLVFRVVPTDIRGLAGTPATCSVPVYMMADANHDSHVDVADLLCLAGAFGSLSGDPNYNPACDFNGDNRVDVSDLLAIARNWGRIRDLQTGIVTVTPTVLGVMEGGEGGTYTMVLGNQPAADVTIRVAPENEELDVGGGPGAARTLTFTPANWSTPQTVLVTAPRDYVIQPSPHPVVIHPTAVSTDPNYDRLGIAAVTVNITDIDTSGGVRVTPTSISVTEGGSAATYSVVLSSRPTANVMITATPPNGELDLGSGPGVARTLTFVPDSWNVAQTVSVSAPQDHVGQGSPHVLKIAHAASSSDPVYDGGSVSIPRVFVQVTDIDGSASSEGVERWEFATGGMIRSSPAIGSDGTVYVGSYDWNLYAIRSDGVQRWRFATGGRIGSSPAVDSGGTIYVGSEDGYLYAINPDGSQKWRCDGAGNLDGSPVIGADGTVYSVNDALRAINPNGSLKWQFGSGLHPSAAIGLGGVIYVKTGYTLYAVNPNGSQRWQLGGGWESGVAMIDASGTIYVGSGAALKAINPDGSIKWVACASEGVTILGSAVIGPDGTIYFGTFWMWHYNIGSLVAVNPDGSKKWETSQYDAYSSSPAISANGTIHIGRTDGCLHAFGPGGSERWVLGTGGAIYSSPAIGADGMIYVGSDGGNLYAIYGSGPLASSPWPMFLHDAKHSGRLP